MSEEEIEDLEQELDRVKTLLWAAIRSNGGRLEILDKHIVECDGSLPIHRYNDAGRSRVVLSVTKP